MSIVYKVDIPKPQINIKKLEFKMLTNQKVIFRNQKVLRQSMYTYSLLKAS